MAYPFQIRVLGYAPAVNFAKRGYNPASQPEGTMRSLI